MRRRRAISLASTLVASALTVSLAVPAVAASPSPHPTSPSRTLASPSAGADQDDTLPYAPRSTPAAAPLTAAQLRSASGTTLSATTSATVHQLDVVIANPSGSTSTTTTADVNSLIADVSSYWAAQTNGKVAFTVKTIKTMTTSSSCLTDYGIGQMWTQASKLVSGGKDWWANGKPQVGPSAREHLVVLYPAEASTTSNPYGQNVCGGMLGLGTTPSTASVGNNGLVFTVFGSRDASASHSGLEFYSARSTLAHELGHNFGLQHADLWWCDSGASDGAFGSAACGLISYEDPFDVMGYTYYSKGVPALSGPQKIRLGLLSSSQRRTVTDTSTVALQPVPDSEKGAAAGLQAAQVKDPSTGDVYTVEYRPTLGAVTFPDVDPPFGQYTIDTTGKYTRGYGVRILRLAPSTMYYSDGTTAWNKNEQSVVPVGPVTNRTSYLPAGQTFTTRSGKVSIKVNSTGPTASVSFTVHRKPSLTLTRSATSQRYLQTAVRVTAKLGAANGAVATGTVTFKDGSTVLKTVTTTSAGVAAYTLPKKLAIKSHTITAAFTPNAATTARLVEATSASTTVKVTKASSAVSVKLAHASVVKGAKPKATITVKVAAVPGPTGTVRVYQNGHTVKTVKLTTSKKGKVTVTLPKTTKYGTAKIVAKYSGTSGIAAKTSATAKLVVKHASSATVKLAHTTVKKGAKPKATITVKATGVKKPTGTIKIYENGHLVKTVKLTAAKKGKVTVTLPKTTKRGTVKIVAKYSGTSGIAAKTSKTVKLKVK